MARKRRRGNESSGGATVAGVVSLILCIGLGLVVVVLKAQRRAARNGDNVAFNGGGNNGGAGNVAPQPFNPGPSNVTQHQGLPPGITETQPIGGIFASRPYREYRDDGAVLIGFEIGLGAVPDTAVVNYLRPIWLTPRGEQFGTAYGRTANPIQTVKARSGYAIGGIVMKSGGAIEGLCFTFMRRGDKHLDAEDFYLSDWYGEPTRKPPAESLRSGGGGFVIGIFGKRYDDKGGTKFEESGCIGTIGLVQWVKE